MLEEGNKEKSFIPKEDDVERSQSGYNNFGVDDKEESIKLNNIYGKGIKGKQIKNMSNQEKESSFTEKPKDEKSSYEEIINDFISSKDEKGKPLLEQNSPVFRIAKSASLPRNHNLLDLRNIKKVGDELYIKGEVKESESDLLGGVIGIVQDEIEELEKASKGEEPEIEMIERPKTPEEAVDVFLDKVFDLHERGLKEDKSWELKGELFSEYTSIQRWMEDLPKEVIEQARKITSKTDEQRKVEDDLNRALWRNYPEGIFLKEKMELFLEAMKRLHNREIEVKRAGGGLEDLGVAKSGESSAPVLKTPLTNIRPQDWYVLTNIDALFPESNNPENKVILQKAWDKWEGICKYPYGFYQWGEYINQGKEKAEGWVLQEKIPAKGEREKLIKNKKGSYKLINWDLKNLEPIKNLTEEHEQGNIFTIKDIYTSDIVKSLFRAKIAEKIGKEVGNKIAGIRTEGLTHSFLTVGLTFEMWDKERWKQKGKQDARDLMWFDWKRVNRLQALRPCGPWDTVGCYFADEKLIEKGFKKEEMSERVSQKELKMRQEYLMRNKNWALFMMTPLTPSRGTIVGDFFNSVTFLEGKNKEGKDVHKRLADVKLKEIPWLDPRQFEDDTYEGHFTYNLLFATIIEGNIKKLQWKTDEELKNKDFWVGLTDSTLRLGHFSPLLVKREKAEQNKLIFKFRRILARGILWTGSYLSQPEPGRVFTSGTLSMGDVYGERLFGVIKSKPGILETIASTGYLDRENMAILKRQIKHFNFFLKGSTYSRR